MAQPFPFSWVVDFSVKPSSLWIGREHFSSNISINLKDDPKNLLEKKKKTKTEQKDHNYHPKKSRKRLVSN